MKALFVATVQSHIAQFHLKAIELLKQNGYEIHVAARNNLAEKNGLELKNVDKVFDIPFFRSPFSSKNLNAYKCLKKVIQKEHYDLIHCNTPVGGILSRIAARKESGKVLYTAHGFHFYKGAPLKNWVLYYPIEKIMTHYTDGLITITEEDYELAKRKFNCNIYRVHGVGINTEKYRCNYSKDCDEKSLIKKQNKTILCTGELNKNKNQETLITAMKTVIEEIPNVCLLLAGNGPEKQNLEKLIHNLGLSKYVKMIGYRTDLPKYVHNCDIVASASYREGLPLNVVEGMYCSKPVVVSNNRGHRELVENNVNGFIVDPKNPNEFAEKIIYLCRHSQEGAEMGKKGYQKSFPYWDINVLNELKEIYW